MSLTSQQSEEFWALADKNKELTLQELAFALRQYRPDLSDKDIVSIFSGIDKNGDVAITKQEFLNEMQDKARRKETLFQLFKQSDTNGDGTLCRDELHKLIATTSKQKSEDVILDEFIKYTDTNGDGVVSREEFWASF